MPAPAAIKLETVLPSLLIHVSTHIHVPALPGPFPAGVGDLRVADVDGAGAEEGVLPGFGVGREEGGAAVFGDAEEEHAALVFVEDV